VSAVAQDSPEVGAQKKRKKEREKKKKHSLGSRSQVKAGGDLLLQKNGGKNNGWESSGSKNAHNEEAGKKS